MDTHLAPTDAANRTANFCETPSVTHTKQSCDIWRKIQQLRERGKVILNGSQLDIASVVAVAKYDCEAYVDTSEELVSAMDGSVKLLEEYLSKGYCVYGVNTGFGGSADTRTTDLASLQSALLQLNQSGILGEADVLETPNPDHRNYSMPVTWVKATMLIRCNSALRGHSGVRLELIETILHLLRNGMTPIIPLRGSISASGDLTPLSYIAGVLEGNPDIFVRINNGPNSKVVTADEALKLLSLEPFILGPKEGLGLVNGTAASTAVACLSAHSTNKLILLSQILVALSCEALLGNASNYHPFISTARPHPGQTECASNILRFLRGSALADPLGQPEKSKPGLFQDRYALRGAPQWLGPQLEDLSLALSQLSLELNSTSDNPLICASSRTIHSGANFLATSISNSVEKTRLALQIAGKLLFALSSELINPALNRGLAPNLAADDPSLSFTIKGVDINLAAYMSELAFLANPVTTHVQSAECHNQSVNALALISARYTVQAAEVLAQMGAALLYVVCQALDLRVLHVCYLRCLREKLAELLEGFLGPGVDAGARESFVEDVYGKVEAEWNTSTALPLAERCDALAEAALPVLISHLQKHSLPLTTDTAVSFQFQLKELAHSTFITQRDQFFAAQNTPEFLGDASKRMYTFVREGLGVPFHRGLVEHPAREPGVRVDGRERKSVGSWVSVVFAAVEDDRIWGPMCDILG